MYRLTICSLFLMSILSCSTSDGSSAEGSTTNGYEVDVETGASDSANEAEFESTGSVNEVGSGPDEADSEQETGSSPDSAPDTGQTPEPDSDPDPAEPDPSPEEEEPPRSCEKDSQCTIDEICEEMLCVDGCRKDLHCLSHEICEELKCIEGCRNDAACRKGNICEELTCIDGCRGDEWCADGMICEHNFCVGGCRDDEACSEGQICEDDLCVDGCRVHDDCSSDELCKKQKCISGCRSDAFCKGGEVCVDEQCQPGCRNDEDCLAGEACEWESLQCQVGCRDHSDCGEGYCVNTQCESPPAYRLTLGRAHSCLRMPGGRLQCWGSGSQGQLGYGSTNSIGRWSTPASVGELEVGGTVYHADAASDRTCAVLEGGRLRCWGEGSTETPVERGDLDVGGEAIFVASSDASSCVLLHGGRLRCWGDNRYGQLGYGPDYEVDSDSNPASLDSVPVGDIVVDIQAGGNFYCALLKSHRVRCWGRNEYGQLGQGVRWYDERSPTPAELKTVKTVGDVQQLAPGKQHVCVLLENGSIQCWGRGYYGQLGYGNRKSIGDTEDTATAGLVDVGGAAVQITSGHDHSCALLEDGNVRCWGKGQYGMLGYGNEANVGDDEPPSSQPPIEIGGKVLSIAAGRWHTCAVLEGGALRCWGSNGSGQLGYGNQENVGDNETPASAGDVPYRE